MDGSLVGWVSPVGLGTEATVVNLLPITAPNAPKLLGVVRLESGQGRTVKLTPRDGELVGYLEIDLAYAEGAGSAAPCPRHPGCRRWFGLRKAFLVFSSR